MEWEPAKDESWHTAPKLLRCRNIEVSWQDWGHWIWFSHAFYKAESNTQQCFIQSAETYHVSQQHTAALNANTTITSAQDFISVYFQHSAMTYCKFRRQHMRGALLVRLNDETEQIIRDKSSVSLWLNPACLSNELVIGAAKHANTRSNIITLNGN